MYHTKQEGKDKIPGGGYLTSCGGPMNKIAVRADGIVTPCAQLPGIALGRINKDNLEDIWQNHPELKRFRERRHIPLNNFEFCRDCDYTNYCMGSCPAMAYTILGNVYHPSPDSCLKRFLEEGGKLPDEELLPGKVMN
jgi:SynChlorMet cassette radical SAM/SPASM protein ScmE